MATIHNDDEKKVYYYAFSSRPLTLVRDNSNIRRLYIRVQMIFRSDYRENLRSRHTFYSGLRPNTNDYNTTDQYIGTSSIFKQLFSVFISANDLAREIPYIVLCNPNPANLAPLPIHQQAVFQMVRDR